LKNFVYASLFTNPKFMYQIIDGRAIAEKVKDKIVKEIVTLKKNRPNLAIVLIGDREDSELYVSLKEKEAKKLGVDTHLYRFDRKTEESEIIEALKFLNQDDLIDGILVQLPLPDKFDTDKIINSIKPEKDVDGFHPHCPDYIISPVLASIKACLQEIDNKADGRSACIFYNSKIFGKGVEQILIAAGYKIISSDKSKEADLIISALGKPEIIKKEQVKKGAAIIDIGITKQANRVYGDADAQDLKDHLSYLTPVPGGIGPMTIAFLFKNVLEIYKRRA